MSDSSDRSAARVLVGITGVLSLAFIFFLLIALDEEPAIALGLAVSAGFGAIAASTFWVTRRNKRLGNPADTPPGGVRALADRLEQLEYDRDVVAQLEERLEFAERLLAEQRNPAQLPRPEATPR